MFRVYSALRCHESRGIGSTNCRKTKVYVENIYIYCAMIVGNASIAIPADKYSLLTSYSVNMLRDFHGTILKNGGTLTQGSFRDGAAFFLMVG